MSEGRKTVIVRIEGRVQGVWYRGWTAQAAERLGLDGWIRNKRDGSVEAVFAGPGAKVDAIIKLCRRGPPLAAVSALHREDYDGEVEPGFHRQ
ncbi:MAG: acylphosphatase [Geminicoccaceae bacterium]